MCINAGDVDKYIDSCLNGRRPSRALRAVRACRMVFCNWEYNYDNGHLLKNTLLSVMPDIISSRATEEIKKIVGEMLTGRAWQK